MSKFLTFADIRASIAKYGKDGLISFKVEAAKEKNAPKTKKKNTTVWVQLKFKKADGSEVRLNLKTPEIYLPGGARNQSEESIGAYGNAKIRIQMYNVPEERINVVENFIRPNSTKEYNTEELAKLSAAVYRNNLEFIEVLDAIDSSIRAAYTKLQAESKNAKVRDTPASRVNSVKFEGFEDEDRKQDFKDNPHYRLTLQVDKESGAVGYKGIETKHQFTPVIFDLSKKPSENGFPEAYVSEDGVRTPITNTNIGSFVTPGSLAIMMLRLESLSIHPQGVSAHLFVTKMMVRANLYNNGNKSQDISHTDLAKLTGFVDEDERDVGLDIGTISLAEAEIASNSGSEGELVDVTF